jgi:hypothetical protein
VNAGLERAASVMSGFPGPWGIAGGWAIDLFLGRESRPHADIDVALLRGHQQHLGSRLPVGGAEKVVEQRLSPWSVEEQLHAPVHEIHATWPDGYHLELLLNEHDREMQQWIFRRDARIRQPLEVAFPRGGALPYLAPEIVLLYKSKAPAAKDDADLISALPHLSMQQREWLRQALATTASEHPWADMIAREP